MERKLKLYTGAGGMDLFEEAMGESQGVKRIWIGNKVPRILRRLKTPIKKSPYTGRYYKQIGLKDFYRRQEEILKNLKWE